MSTGPLMLDLEGTSLTEEESQLLRHPAVGGVIFFARNVVSRDQLMALVASLRAVRSDLLLSVDQEGGRVQRFVDGFTRLPPAAELGAFLAGEPELGAELIRDCGWLMAAEILASGLDFSFAPVLDLDAGRCAAIGNRAFADSAELVTRAAALYVEGMHQAGMAATGKHFPGHGGVAADSHLETPVDSRSLAELEGRDLVPFRELAGRLDAVMPAHIVFPAVDDACVGFSRHWLGDILRGELGFSGVIFSDDLNMKGAGIAGDFAARARSALGAGCDMVLVCNNREGARTVLDCLDASGGAIPLHSPRLKTMMARRRWNWDELMDNPRHRRTVNRLVALIDGN